ncbi:MAG: phosphatase PAP2 family protein [Clostridia bacterium]|nr:phosphatase PAP2 family protein [Clostridia bacterium]
MRRKDLWMLLGWPVYLVLFFLSERWIPPERCVPIWCPLDDRIPFCEWFVIPYVSWYPLIAGSLVLFLLQDRALFRRLQGYILMTQAIGLICFFLLPSRQDLRPENFPRDGILTKLVGFLYAADTPTGVCPSMHVAWSLALISAWTRKRDCSPLLKVSITAWCALICISVVFVKQHSVLDILAGIMTGLTAEGLLHACKKRGYGVE